MNNQAFNTEHKTPAKSKPIRTAILLFGLFFCLFLLVRYVHNLRFNDFIEYWSAAKVILLGGNPYNPDELMIFQQQGGLIYPEPIKMYNPPWTLALIAIFGIFDRSIGQLIWLLLNISILLLCAIQLWKIYQGQISQHWIALMSVFLFAPTIIVLGLGQITPLVLLGLVGFLFFTVKQRNDWAAGLSLVLVSIKPQLALIFWLAILFWVIQERRSLILISAAGGILILSGLAIALNPSLIQQYINLISSGWMNPQATPTIGAYLRFFWLGTANLWPQFVPAVIGGLGFIYYWNIHNHPWQWENELPLTLLVSAVISPFAWTYDYVILLPAIIQVMCWFAQDWKRWPTIILVGILIAINVLDFILHIRLNDFWFVWMAPALFIWFLSARWQFLGRNNKVNLPVTEVG